MLNQVRSPELIGHTSPSVLAACLQARKGGLSATNPGIYTNRLPDAPTIWIDLRHDSSLGSSFSSPRSQSVVPATGFREKREEELQRNLQVCELCTKSGEHHAKSCGLIDNSHFQGECRTEQLILFYLLWVSLSR